MLTLSKETNTSIVYPICCLNLQMEAICTIDEADAIRTKLTVYKDYVEILKYWLGKNSCLHRNVAISYFCLVVTLMTFFFFLH